MSTPPFDAGDGAYATPIRYVLSAYHSLPRGFVERDWEGDAVSASFGETILARLGFAWCPPEVLDRGAVRLSVDVDFAHRLGAPSWFRDAAAVNAAAIHQRMLSLDHQPSPDYLDGLATAKDIARSCATQNYPPQLGSLDAYSDDAVRACIDYTIGVFTVGRESGASLATANDAEEDPLALTVQALIIEGERRGAMKALRPPGAAVDFPSAMAAVHPPDPVQHRPKSTNALDQPSRRTR